MIKLYTKNKVLIGNLSECSRAIAIEERNGMCEIEIDYQLFSPHWDKLIRGNIIETDLNDKITKQLFRIYKVTKDIMGHFTVYAKHISFDLGRDYIESIDIENQSCEYCLNTLFRNSQFSQAFKGYSDIVNAQNYKINNVNLLKAIAGEKGSILDTFGTGAEIKRDNYDFYVLNKRGHDNGVVIEYASNLTGLDYEEDEEGLITRIRAVAKYTPKNEEGNNSEEKIIYTYVDSKNINNYETPFIAEIDFSDKFEEDEIPTIEKLTTLANKYFEENKCDIMKFNYEISFIPLSKCAGYEDIQDQIELCDTVTIIDYRYDLNTKAKVIKTTYDILKQRYESMELGEPRTSLGDIFSSEDSKGEKGDKGDKGEDGSMGDFPNTLPTIPTLSAKVLGFASIELSWTYENKVYYNYEIYASKTKGFTPNTFDIIHAGQTSSFLFQAKPNETWYFRACAINTHGQRTEFSDEIEVITTKVDDLENYFSSAAIGNAVVGSLTSDYMEAGIIKGEWIDAKNLSVTDGNGNRTLDIDSFGNVSLDVSNLKVSSKSLSETYVTKEEVNLINYNIINNGDFQNCYAGTYDMIPSWICDNDLKVYYYRDDGEGWAFLNESTTLGDIKGVRQNIDLKGNTVYTLSFKAGWQEHVNQGMEGYIEFYDGSWNTLSTITIPITNNNLNLSDLQTFTFTTPADFYDCEIKFFFGEHIGFNDLLCVSFLHEVKLEEGDTYTGWRCSKYDETHRFGGTNYIKNGDFSNLNVSANTIDSWGRWGTASIWHDQGIGNYTKKGILYLSNPHETEAGGIWQDVYDCQRRTEYTLSFDIDWEGNVKDTYVDLVFYSNGTKLFEPIEFRPNKAGRYSYTFVTPDKDNMMFTVGLIHMGSYDSGGGFLVQFGNVMLERGNIVSDWSESPNYFTTKTEFQQTNEDFTFRISQSGGGNLLKNSKFHNRSTEKWWYWGAAGTWHNVSYFQEGDMYFYNQSANRGGLISDPFNIEPNTVYTLSCLCGWEGNVKGAFISIEYYVNGNIVAEQLVYPQNDSNSRQHFTFTSLNYSVAHIGFQHEGMKDTSNEGGFLVRVSRPCLQKGYGTEWVPHPSEIYDGIVKISNTGISVQHANNKSVLDSEALKFYNGNSVFSKVDGGIFKFMNPNNISNAVGAVGRYTWANNGAYNNALTGGYGSCVSMGCSRTEGGAAAVNIIDSSVAGNVTGTSTYFEQGLNISVAQCDTLNFKKDRTQPSDKEANVDALTIWGSNANGLRTGNLYSADQILMGIAYNTLRTGIRIAQSEGWTNNLIVYMYGPLDMGGYPIANAQNISTLSARSSYTQTLLNRGSNDLYTYGSYSYEQGEVRWCCKETVFTYAEADIDPVTDEWVYTGRNICYVELPIFMAENIEADYHISIGKIGWGDYRILEKNQYYFILESQEEDFAFTFEVVAKLVDGETLNNNTSIAGMSTTANPAILNEEPQQNNGEIIPGTEEVHMDKITKEDNMDNSNI